MHGAVKPRGVAPTLIGHVYHGSSQRNLGLPCRSLAHGPKRPPASNLSVLKFATPCHLNVRPTSMETDPPPPNSSRSQQRETRPMSGRPHPERRPKS